MERCMLGHTPVCMTIGLWGLPQVFPRPPSINIPERSNEKESLLFHECPDGIDIDKSENLAKPPNGPGGWPGLPEGNPCNPHSHSVAQHSSLAPKNKMVLSRIIEEFECSEYKPKGLRPPSLESMLVMGDNENFLILRNVQAWQTPSCPRQWYCPWELKIDSF